MNKQNQSVSSPLAHIQGLRATAPVSSRAHGVEGMEASLSHLAKLASPARQASPGRSSNPNPCILIPWMRIPEDWTVKKLTMWAVANNYQRRYLGSQHSFVSLRIDKVWWDYMELGDRMWRRPSLRCPPQVHAARSVPPPTSSARSPTFRCQVCAKIRPAEYMKTVQCGEDKLHSLSYEVCTYCCQKGALDRTRKLGFYAQVSE